VGKPLKAALRAILVLAIAAALVVAVFLAGPDAIATALKALRPASLAWASLAFMAALFMNALRWRLVSPPALRAGPAFTFAAYLSGVFGNVITPGARFGGEPFKAFFMMSRRGGRFSDHLSVVLLDKTVNGVSFMSFIFGSLALVCVRFLSPFAAIPLAAAAAAAAALPPVLLVMARKLEAGPIAAFLSRPAAFLVARAAWTRKLFRVTASKEEFRVRASERIEGFFRPFVSLSPGKALAAFGFSSAYWLLACLCNWILFRSLGLGLSYPAALAVMTLSTLISDMGATPAGLGFVETAMIGILAAYRISGDKAMAATLVSRTANLVLSLGIGGTMTLVLTAVYGKIPEKDVREAKIAAGGGARSEAREKPGGKGEGAL
jgi:glycosyltransferase 2 family protein